MGFTVEFQSNRRLTSAVPALLGADLRHLGDSLNAAISKGLPKIIKLTFLKEIKFEYFKSSLNYKLFWHQPTALLGK